MLRMDGALCRQIHVAHVVVVVQQPLQELPDGLHLREQPDHAGLDRPQLLEVSARHLCSSVCRSLRRPHEHTVRNEQLLGMTEPLVNVIW